MNFFGIGALELALILVVGLMLVGPMEMVNMARKAGAFVRQFKESDLWQSVQGSRRTMDKVGRELLGDRSSELDSIRKELSKIDLTARSDGEIVKKFQELKAGLTATFPVSSNGFPEKQIPDLDLKVPQIDTEQKS